jgi:H+/Cl- antiporter ClcA
VSIVYSCCCKHWVKIILNPFSHFISKDAEGSGIPEIKSILAGVNIYRYLSFRTMVGKIIGLTAGLSAGLSIGKEGPFVHIAASVANKLMKLKSFNSILSVNGLYLFL